LFLRELAKFPVTLAVELAVELVDFTWNTLFIASRAAEAFPVVRLGIVLDGLTRIHGLVAGGARDATTTQTQTVGCRLVAFFFRPLDLGLLSGKSVLFPALLAVQLVLEHGRLVHGQFFLASRALEAIPVVDLVLKLCDFGRVADSIADGTRHSATSQTLYVKCGRRGVGGGRRAGAVVVAAAFGCVRGGLGIGIARAGWLGGGRVFGAGFGRMRRIPELDVMLYAVSVLVDFAITVFCIAQRQYL